MQAASHMAMIRLGNPVVAELRVRTILKSILQTDETRDHSSAGMLPGVNATGVFCGTI